MPTIPLTVNGELHHIQGVPAHLPLLDWLRSHARLTGSKQGCAEGDCGACTVLLRDTDPTGAPVLRAINSCIAPLASLAGRHILTVESLAPTPASPLHPVQQALVACHGSQCGYCTPGIAMSLRELHSRGPAHATDPATIADQLCGNLCRCTGYRPIRDAALASAPAAPEALPPAPEPPAAPFHYTSPEGHHLHRPATLPELLHHLHLHPDARLLAGATEIGVEINKKHLRPPRLLSTDSIPELRLLAAEPDHWRIGAAVNLVDLQDFLASQPDPPAPLLRILPLFASRQIRHRATLGGNLATASPIGDTAPVLLALDATLLLATHNPHGQPHTRTLPLADFFLAYRRTALAPGEIIQEIHLPRPHALLPTPAHTLLADAYKISKRREMDISIISAAFALVLRPDGHTIHSARLAYGGVAPVPARAREAESLLPGLSLRDPAALANVTAALRRAFTPITDTRATAPYRLQLVTNLWEKFLSRQTSLAHDLPPSFITHPDDHPPSAPDPTRTQPHESAHLHATGRAHYTLDPALQRPMLEVHPVTSPHAHARILRRDIAPALHLPGVHAILLAEDIPGENNSGPIRHDEPLLATDLVSYHSQIIALVVADTPEQARLAAAAVIVEYQPLHPVVTLPQAIAANSYHTEPKFLQRGDPAPILATAPHQVSGELHIGGQDHFYLETQAAWAEPGDDRDITVHSSTQHPTEIQIIVAATLALPRHLVTVRSHRMGGGFGGKETQGNFVAALVALAAQRTRRPVRWQLDRDLDMRLTGKRHPFHATYRAAHTPQGHLLATHVTLLADGGWSLDLSQPILDRALFHLDNAYHCPHTHHTGRVALTHTTSHTAFRGFGGPQGALVAEEIIAHVARATGLPPHHVRRLNLYHARPHATTTHYHMPVDDRLTRIWDHLLATSDFLQRHAAVTAHNTAAQATGNRVRRGIAITPAKFGISFTIKINNQAGAYLLLYTDGTLQVNHGGTEMGQGLHTKIVSIVMRELGLPAASIRIMPTQTDKIPNTPPTAASTGSDLNGAAVADACRTLRERLLPLAAHLLTQQTGQPLTPASLTLRDNAVHPPGDTHPPLPIPHLALRAHQERLNLAATGHYATPGLDWDWNTKTGRPFHYFAYGAAVTEIELDGWTGQYTILRADLLQDTGDSLHPATDRGQIEGGYVQSLGWLTREQLKWSKDGHLLTHGASTYDIPAFSDAPADLRVELLPHATQPGVIHGSKAVGEPPYLLAFSAREALRHALSSLHPAPATLAFPSPATPETLLLALPDPPPA